MCTISYLNHEHQMQHMHHKGTKIVLLILI